MPKILHLGAGSFHRAHQAVYLHQLHQLGDREWTLTIGQLRSDMNDVMNQLASQNGVYTLETVDENEHRVYTTIESIERVIQWTETNQELLEAGVDPDCKIISFTVTEGGYYLDDYKELLVEHPDIVGDTGANGAKKTIYGMLTAMLKLRQKQNVNDSITLLSCDNVRGNGDHFLCGMLKFLEVQKEHELLQWIKKHTKSPNSMVDRITPKPTEVIRKRVQIALGINDAVPVMSEAFCQWVLEDNFAQNLRPAWERVGVQLVDSVVPYEEAKIRILNASHSCCAWAGTLLNLKYIAESVSVPEIRQFVYDYVTNDVIPSLMPSPVQLDRYRDQILHRFSNAHLYDTNQRVTADGFSKIPGFILPTMVERLRKKDDAALPRSTAVLCALFFRFLERWHRGTLPFVYQDGAMNAATVHGYFESGDAFSAFIAERQLWGGELANDPRLARVVRDALQAVDDWVAKAAVEN